MTELRSRLDAVAERMPAVPTLAELASRIEFVSTRDLTTAAAAAEVLLREEIEALRAKIAGLARRIDAADPVEIELASIRPLDDVVREHVVGAVRRCGGVRRAADAIAVAPSTIYRMLRGWHEPTTSAKERSSP